MRPLPLALLLIGCSSPDTGEQPVDTDVSPVADCPDYDEVSSIEVRDSALTEASGLVLGTDGVLWSHNDSGDRPRLIAVSTEGAPLGEIDITNVQAQDWEDIARFDHPDLGSTLVVADLGDNDRQRTDTSLILVQQPTAPGMGRRLSLIHI